MFRANHSKGLLKLGPIEDVKGGELPDACLSWGSFPCQDLSLAGKMGGISSERSGLVWEWLRAMDEMKQSPPIVVAENVLGLLSSANGLHYQQLHKALVNRGYKVGALIMDAVHWVPQSRKRVFVIAVTNGVDTQEFELDQPQRWCHSDSLQKVARGLTNWVWWRIPEPTERSVSLDDVIDFSVPCDGSEQRARLLSLIPQKHMDRIRTDRWKSHAVFPGYKRIRNGKQVLEVRFDGIAGCLRTPQGGSSRQFLIIRSNGRLNTRLLTVSEAAALMGARRSYKIPGSYNDGYRAMGDAVAVPVSRYLARHLFAPLASAARWSRP